MNLGRNIDRRKYHIARLRADGGICGACCGSLLAGANGQTVEPWGAGGCDDDHHRSISGS